MKAQGPCNTATPISINIYDVCPHNCPNRLPAPPSTALFCLPPPSSPGVNPAGERAGDELAELLVRHLAAGIAKNLEVLREGKGGSVV